MSPSPFPFTAFEVKLFIRIAKQSWRVTKARERYNTQYPSYNQIQSIEIPVDFWQNLDLIESKMKEDAISSSIEYN